MARDDAPANDQHDAIKRRAAATKRKRAALREKRRRERESLRASGFTKAWRILNGGVAESYIASRCPGCGAKCPLEDNGRCMVCNVEANKSRERTLARMEGRYVPDAD